MHVQTEFAEAVQPGGRGCCRLFRMAAQHSADARQQLPGIEWLGEIIIGPDLQSDNAVNLIPACRQHEDRDVARAAQALGNAQAVFSRQHQVEDDQVSSMCFQVQVHGRAVVYAGHRVALFTEVALQQFPQRRVVIHDIALEAWNPPQLVFSVHCSKGTYVRTLVEDIAARAGTVAHTANLHRESVGVFAAGDMLEMGTIEAISDDGDEALRARLLPPDAALGDMPALELNSTNAAKFAAGQEILLPVPADTGLVRGYEEGQIFRGVGELAEDGRLAPKRVFRTAEKNS